MLCMTCVPPKSYVGALTPSAFKRACIWRCSLQSKSAVHRRAEKTGKERSGVPGPLGSKGDENKHCPGMSVFWRLCSASCPWIQGGSLYPSHKSLHSAWIEWICLPYKQRIAHRISLQGHALCCRCSMSEAQRHSWMYRIALLRCSFIHLFSHISFIFTYQMCIRCCFGEGSSEKQNQEEIRGRGWREARWQSLV